MRSLPHNASRVAWRAAGAESFAGKARRALRGLGYIRGLRSFLTLGNFELYRIAFLQALVAFGANRAVVDKYVWPIRAADEPVSLGVIEPLHSSFHAFHVKPPSSCTSFRWGNLRTCPQSKCRQ